MIILKADYKKYNVSELEKLRMDEEKFYETFDNAITNMQQSWDNLWCR